MGLEVIIVTSFLFNIVIAKSGEGSKQLILILIEGPEIQSLNLKILL